MLFNATFNNISVISWRSVLLAEEAGMPVDNSWLELLYLYLFSRNSFRDICTFYSQKNVLK
jgi:hypothetical protein